MGKIKVMKTVYERLRPELVAQIEKESVKYPTSMEALIKRLQAEFFFTDVRYGDVITLESMYQDAFGKKCDHMSYCFKENI